MTGSPLAPPASLLCKLGSIVAHVDEMYSEDGHVFDKHALDALMADSEVRAWLAAMDKMALLPKRRS